VGFKIPVALDAPVMMGEFINQHFFGERSGLMLGAEVCSERVQFLGVFTWDAGELGVDSVLECIFRRSGFAFGGFRASAFLGVFAIDFGAGALGLSGFCRFLGHDRRRFKTASILTLKWLNRQGYKRVGCDSFPDVHARTQQWVRAIARQHICRPGKKA
jgi:hypothetical protein